MSLEHRVINTLEELEVICKNKNSVQITYTNVFSHLRSCGRKLRIFSKLELNITGKKHKRNTSATSSSFQSLLMTGQLTLVTKSNALRKAAKEKTIQLQEVEDKLSGKLESLKGC